jgi:hypothetical protein
LKTIASQMISVQGLRFCKGNEFMPITLTCPSCGQQCAVKEEYAGMQVRCPRCPGVISVPAAVPAVVIADAEPVAAMPATSAPPPIPEMPRAQGGPAFMDNVTRFLAANGVSGINFILFLVGLGCMALFLITVLFPWVGVSGGGFSFLRLGIQISFGIIEFLLVLAVLFLLVFVVLMGWSKLFDYCLWTASNLSVFIALHLLAMIGGAAWGMIISLVVMFAAAATLGIVALTKVFASKPM